MRRALLGLERSIYAVGDVHGRADLLLRLIEKIESQIEISGELNPLIVFLGDYVDRGYESYEVIEIILRFMEFREVKVLRGNHEDMLLNALSTPDSIASWRAIGGLETLMSYGVNPTDVSRGRGYSEASAGFSEKIPERHRLFFESLDTSHIEGDFYFCHAGIRPGIPLDLQSPLDLLWIREPFLSYTDPHPKIIVHGHTPGDDVEFLNNRINVDTGAYLSNKLSCVRLARSGESIIQASF